jgi:hypothetical protein
MSITLQSTLVQGETLNYRATVADYPAGDGWVLTLYLNPRAGGTARSVVGTADGDEHLLQATAATTANWAAGSYGWEIWASYDVERYRIDAGQLDVAASLISAAAGADTRTQAESALDAAKTALAAWTPTTRRYRINGREMEFNSAAEIIAVITHWESEVRRERAAAAIAAGRPTRRKVHVRMARA